MVLRAFNRKLSFETVTMVFCALLSLWIFGGNNQARAATITKENKRLYLQSKLGKVVIHPETEALFFVKADNTKILFVRKEGGEVTGMTVDLMGIGLRVINAEKLNNNF